MNKTKKGIILIIEVLLMFSIMFAVLAVFLKGIVLNENTYINILNQNNTYQQITESIYSKIDALLSAKNINYDIKESIITEDDIKNESENMISGVINYLKTGENDIKPVNTEIYRQRVADILNSVIRGTAKPATNNLSFNDNLQMQNVVCIGNQKEFDNMLLVKDNSKGGQDSVVVERLMNKTEAEAKVREILDQKGLTVDQAIEKARKKGITEDQALNILAGYGITIDGETDSNAKGSESESSDKSQVQSSNSNESGDKTTENTINKASDDKTTENTINKASDDKTTENTINKASSDKNIENPLNSIANKLLDEAGSNIEKEVEKINFNKILESDKLQKIAKVTSIIYKNFWIFLALPIIFMVILIKINKKDFNYSLKYIRNAFLLAGLILFAIFFGAYVLKVYEKFNINIVYFKDLISYTIRHFLIILSTYGIITFAVGLFLFIPTIIKNPSKENYNM